MVLPPYVVDAARRGDLRALEAYFSAGRDVDEVDDTNQTALWHACYEEVGYAVDDINTFGCVKFLLARGANVNREVLSSGCGILPLYGACCLNGGPPSTHMRVIRLLVESGANVNAIDRYQDTALGAIINLGALKSPQSAVGGLQILLRHGARLNGAYQGLPAEHRLQNKSLRVLGPLWTNRPLYRK